MALRSKREELDSAWRALTGYQSDEGWRTIAVGAVGPCRLLAGRHFPGNEEAILAGFHSVRVPPTDQLPQGAGFDVSKVDIDGEESRQIWIALRRQLTGNVDLFTMMADDVIVTLERQRITDNDQLFHVFISRIRAWQEFMRRGIDELLGPEAEMGLFGELSFMHDLLGVGLPAEVVVDAWQGPLDGMHDFSFGAGAIEVKSTVSALGFPAKFGTLDQLDDSLVRPLFLTAVRLEINPSGKSLSTLICEMRAIIDFETFARANFDNRLLHLGYLDTTADRYTRCFCRTGFRLLTVASDFPRLTRANVPIEIRKVRYEIDLDLISSGDLVLIDALKQLGVI
ncbi:MAG: PD-(D/E)XK motif protein [Methylococcales bacterium]